MSDVTAKLAEALRLISFASMDRGARDTATEALAAYEAAQAEPKQATEPVAWMYEIATNVLDDGYDGWTLCLTRYRPNVPEGALRGLTPLFPAPVAQAEPRKPLTDIEAEALSPYQCCSDELQQAWLSGFRIAEREYAKAWGVKLVGIGASAGSGNG